MWRARWLASTINYDRNDGRPGVVYVLANAAFRDDWWKISQSTRSGHHRARDLNFEASTGTPKHFHCVFEVPTKDCGRAEKAVHARLAQYRMGATGQEYFCVPLETAKAVIVEECERIDAQPVIAPQQVIAQHDGPAQGTPARKSFDPGTVAAQLSAQPHSGKVLLQGLNLSQLNAVRRAQARQFSAAIERTPARRPSIADGIFREAALLIPSIFYGFTAAALIGLALLMLVHVGNWVNGTRLSNRETGRLALWIVGTTWFVATAVLRAKVFRGRR
jgi:hypothetical protein